MNFDDFSRQGQSKAMGSRFILVGICAWISCCLLIAGWLPELSGNLQSVWLTSGLLGLVSSVGLAETIKSDMKRQENLLKEYMEAAMTDGLTGLANRHSLDRSLEHIISQSPARRGALSMIMIDIDHFKSLNDEFGHPAGDAVLRTFSKKMKEFFGQKTMSARYGGEEFVVLLPGYEMPDTVRMAESFRQVVKQMPCEFRERQFYITISCGVTTAGSQDSADSLTRRADMALYTAKKNGRDMVWGVPAQPSAVPPTEEERVLATIAATVAPQVSTAASKIANSLSTF